VSSVALVASVEDDIVSVEYDVSVLEVSVEDSVAMVSDVLEEMIS